MKRTLTFNKEYLAKVPLEALKSNLQASGHVKIYVLPHPWLTVN